MNIWLLNPYGPIPGEGWRDYRFTTLGQSLAQRGHSVIWWTSNFSHHFKRFRSDTWQDQQVSPGFVIRLVPTTAYTRNISLGRVRSELAYVRQVSRQAPKSGRPDCIIGTDPPQPLGYLSVKLASKFGVPLILDVFDLWPELFRLAFPPTLRPLAPAVFAPLHLLRKRNLRRADAVVTLCDTYLDVVRRDAPRLGTGDVLTVFNGIDVAAFQAVLPDDREAAILAQQMGKEPGDVWAVYAGSLGNNYDIETLLQAASKLAGCASRVRIWVAGEGPLRSRVTEFVDTQPLINLTYLGKLKHEDLIRFYGVCDIGLCAYGPESNVGMPDKAYDYMAAGLPIINSLRGELEALLRKEHVGIQYRAGNADSLVEALTLLERDERGRHILAQNSRNAAMRFDRHLQYAQYVDFVEARLARAPHLTRGGM